MNAIQPPTPSYAAQAAAMAALGDPAVRRRIRADPRQYALDNGLLPAGSAAEVRVVVNRRATLYVPIARADWPDSFTVDAADLESLQAAGTASTAGSASTAGTASTITSTVGTLASAATAACAGTASE